MEIEKNSNGTFSFIINMNREKEVKLFELLYSHQRVSYDVSKLIMNRYWVDTVTDVKYLELSLLTLAASHEKNELIFTPKTVPLHRHDYVVPTVGCIFSKSELLKEFAQTLLRCHKNPHLIQMSELTHGYGYQYNFFVLGVFYCPKCEKWFHEADYNEYECVNCAYRT